VAVISHLYIDGQVRLVRSDRLQIDNFRLLRTNDKLRLPDEQTIKELRKIAWASVFRFRLKRPHIYTVYIFQYMYTENGNGKRKFVFLGRQTIYGNRRLLF
jgi:hypothetical protein